MVAAHRLVFLLLTSKACVGIAEETTCALSEPNFAGSLEGVTCGTHPTAESAQGCCASKGSCVACLNSWRCDELPYVTVEERCRVCGDDDLPKDCTGLDAWYRHNFYQAWMLEDSFAWLFCLLLFILLIWWGGRSFNGPRRAVMVQPNGFAGAAPNFAGAAKNAPVANAVPIPGNKPAPGAPIVHGSPMPGGVPNGKAML